MEILLYTPKRDQEENKKRVASSSFGFRSSANVVRMVVTYPKMKIDPIMSEILYGYVFTNLLSLGKINNDEKIQ